ncbi:hypothetical protein HanOQP8_Chr12g0451411 [Helianthus annuus]|nr:hypothetical protein HanOQP8_Chr12g0451411 [Helianthus annuus]
MDHENNAPSLLKLIENYDPIFLEIPYDFATLLWGEQLPYVNVLKLVMMIYLMDPKNNSHSLLKLIEEYDPIFLVCVYFGWSGVFGCNYVGQRYACYCCKLVPCRLVLLGKICDDASDKQHWENIQP